MWLDADCIPLPDPGLSEPLPAEKSLTWAQCSDLIAAHILGSKFADFEFQHCILDELEKWLAYEQKPDLDTLETVFAEKASPQLKFFAVDRMFAGEANVREILRCFVQRVGGPNGGYGRVGVSPGSETLSGETLSEELIVSGSRVEDDVNSPINNERLEDSIDEKISLEGSGSADLRPGSFGKQKARRVLGLSEIDVDNPGVPDVDTDGGLQITHDSGRLETEPYEEELDRAPQVVTPEKALRVLGLRNSVRDAKRISTTSSTSSQGGVSLPPESSSSGIARIVSFNPEVASLTLTAAPSMIKTQVTCRPTKDLNKPLPPLPLNVDYGVQNESASTRTVTTPVPDFYLDRREPTHSTALLNPGESANTTLGAIIERKPAPQRGVEYVSQMFIAAADAKEEVEFARDITWPLPLNLQDNAAPFSPYDLEGRTVDQYELKTLI